MLFKVKLAAIAIIVSGLLFAALSYLAPIPHLTAGSRSLVDENTYHSTLAFLVASTTFGFGGSLLFLLGLDGFTKAFRRIYHFICAGFIVQGLGSLYYVYGGYQGIVKTDIFSVIAEIPLMLGIVIVYAGFVSYARLLHINSPLTKPLVAAAGFAVLITIVTLLPHRTDLGSENELLFDIAHGMQAVELFMYLVAALIAAHIRNTAGPLYARSMWWLKWAQLTAFPATLVLFGEDYIKLYSWLDTDVMSLLFILTNIFTICSAYAFNKIARVHVQQETYDNSLLDSVVFLGSLASNPAEIDLILDKVRLITSGRAGGAEDVPLTLEQTHTLQTVYTELEEYLVTKERVRVFDRQSLDELVQERFNWPPTP